MTRHYQFLFSDAFSTAINPMLRLNHPDLRLEKVLEEESVEFDTVIVQTRKLDHGQELIQYNKHLKDESENKMIQKERDLLTREDLIRKEVVNIKCINVNIKIYNLISVCKDWSYKSISTLM